jgi:beta-barrel assembly-enhancing protease
MKRLAAICAAALLAAPVAADGLLATPGYAPTDKDERGLWLQMEEQERELKRSNFVIRDPGLNAYVRKVFCKTVGEAECAPIRIYIMRTPYFNATMAPNGMMQVWSGLLLRTRDEAQLAAVLGHEYVHYERRHSVQLFKAIKKNLALGAVLGGLVPGANLLLVGSIFANSREMERESDSGSVQLLAKAGYDPMASSRIWEQIRLEMDATAEARNKKSRKDKGGGMFATHPTTLDRMTDLKALAAQQKVAGAPVTNRAAYVKALAPFWASIVDDQIKLNDFGATEFLLTHLASEGWTGDLLFARGELYRSRGRPEDMAKAAGFYREAVADPQVPVEAWRGLGYALIRSGDQPGGKVALQEYLKRKPDAPDKAMIAMMAGA